MKLTKTEVLQQAMELIRKRDIALGNWPGDTAIVYGSTALEDLTTLIAIYLEAMTRYPTFKEYLEAEDYNDDFTPEYNEVLEQVFNLQKANSEPA